MKATATRAIYEATAMEVFIAGGRCAAHFHSRAGTVVVVLPLAEFVRKARRDVDGNRRFFPRDMPSAVCPPPSGRGWKNGALPPARLAAYQAARRAHEAQGATLRAAAAQVGVEVNSLRSWLRKARARERQVAA